VAGLFDGKQRLFLRMFAFDSGELLHVMTQWARTLNGPHARTNAGSTEKLQQSVCDGRAAGLCLRRPWSDFHCRLHACAYQVTCGYICTRTTA
jgi:hypothetical protein